MGKIDEYIGSLEVSEEKPPVETRRAILARVPRSNYDRIKKLAGRMGISTKACAEQILFHGVVDMEDALERKKAEASV